MAIQIKTAGLEQFLEGGDGRYRILLYGPPGSGKTPWAAQAPNPFFMMCDRGGENSLVLTKTPYAQVYSEAAAHEAIDYLARESLKPNRKYDTVVLDTMSVLQKHLLNEMLRKNGQDSPDDFREWGELSAKVSKILYRLQRLDMHVIVTVHTKEKFGSDVGELEAALTGGMRDELGREFPYIGWIHSDWGIVRNEDGVITSQAAEPKRQIAWKATSKMPFLRSASALLPATTPVTFTPKDWDVIVSTVTAGAAKIDTTSTVLEVVETEVEKFAAKPDAVSGPVTPNPAALPKASAATKAKAAKPVAKPEPEVITPEPAEDAQTLIESSLGGEVIEQIDLAEVITAVTPQQFKAAPSIFSDLWNEHKAIWTPELSELVKSHRAALTAV